MAEFTDEDLKTLLGGNTALADAINAYAMRPQKESVITDTTSTSTPYALQNMIANRDRIGQATQELDNALKMRETTGYSLANALASLPQQQGYGSWLTDFARSLGGGMVAPMNAVMARANTKYENQMKDLASILAYDKAMGETQTQHQAQTMGYTQMPYGSVKKDAKASAAPETTEQKISKSEVTAGNLADIYKTIEDNPTLFSSIGSIKQTEEDRALRKGIETAGLKDMQHSEFEFLRNMFPGGFATAFNTAKEQEIMAPYTAAFKEGTGAQRKAQIKNMLGAIYDNYKLVADERGVRMPISKEDYINSRIGAGRAYNKKFYTQSGAPMYKESTKAEPKETSYPNETWKSFMEGTL